MTSCVRNMCTKIIRIKLNNLFSSYGKKSGAFLCLADSYNLSPANLSYRTLCHTNFYVTYLLYHVFKPKSPFRFLSRYVVWCELCENRLIIIY